MERHVTSDLILKAKRELMGIDKGNNALINIIDILEREIFIDKYNNRRFTAVVDGWAWNKGFIMVTSGGDIFLCRKHKQSTQCKRVMSLSEEDLNKSKVSNFILLDMHHHSPIIFDESKDLIL